MGCYFECGCGFKFLDETEMTAHRNLQLSHLCLDAYSVNTYTNQKLLIDRRTPVSSLTGSENDAGEHDVSEDQPEVESPR